MTAHTLPSLKPPSFGQGKLTVTNDPPVGSRWLHRKDSLSIHVWPPGKRCSHGSAALAAGLHPGDILLTFLVKVSRDLIRLLLTTHQFPCFFSGPSGAPHPAKEPVRTRMGSGKRRSQFYKSQM